MANTTDGGPAFPRPAHIEYDEWKNRERVADGSVGMSLRDYFAGKALCEYLAAHMADDKQVDEDVLADCAYSMADAMLRARAAQSPAEISYAQAAGRGKRQSPTEAQK